MLKSLWAFSFILLLAPFSHALFLASPQGKIDPNKTTRILLSGRGTDLGMGPQLSALSRALLYQRNFPDHQIILLSVFENEKNENLLLQAGWKILKKNDTKLETKSAVAEIKNFKRIRSLEFFGHNSPSIGTQSDGMGMRFDPSNHVVDQLAPLFEKDAYAIFHGCNSGWIIAQDLSKRWKIAVAGSFTGTRFERLHSDGHFYVASDDKAPSADWARKNDDLGLNTCSGGGCLRMRPAYGPYVGKWGNFRGPMLSHYKFFCQQAEGACEKIMAQSLFGYLAEKTLTRNSSAEEFADVARQYFCPVYKDRVITEDCLKELDQVGRTKILSTLNFIVNAPQLTCDLRSCTGKMTCVDHNCTLADRQSTNSSTLTQEYLHILKGFELLKAEGF